MELIEKMPVEQAKNEIHAFLDRKRMKPLKRKEFEKAIDLVAEAMQFGEVVINDDGSITQTLGEPLGETTELKFKARVAPEHMVKAEQQGSPRGRTGVYVREYTGLTDNQINRLSPPDWDTASCISLFFM